MKQRSVDIAIIGGGIMGASLAWHLAKTDAGRVALFERSVIGAGASGRTGALLRRHYSNRPEAILAHRSWQTFANWPDVVGGEPVHTPAGLIVTVQTTGDYADNVDRMRRNVTLQNEVGIPSQMVSRAELQELQPFAAWDDIAFAAYEPDSGYVDAVAATRSMAHAAIAAGAEIHEGAPVVAVLVEGDRVRGVQLAQEKITADVVVIAAGPWTPALTRPIGVKVPLEALRVQVAILQRPLSVPEHMVYLDTVCGIFARPWAPGRTLIGVGGGDQHNPVDPDSFEQRNDPGYGQTAIDALSRRVPAMSGAAYLHGHAGLYDMTPDAHPILGQAGPDGLYLMAGFSGAGFKKAPAVGEALGCLILGQSPEWVDLRPFRWERFAENAWHHPWSDDEYRFSSDFGHGL